MLKDFINCYMAATITIELTGLRFHAFHGLYEEEKKTGNEFEVNLWVDYIPSAEVISEISDTVNYADLFGIVRSGMNKPTALLETLAIQITEAIWESFPQIKKTDILISKLHPPITQFTGRVGVRYSKEI